MLKCTTRSQIESSRLRSAPWPPRNVFMYHSLEQRGGSPRRASPVELQRFHNSSIDLRCTSKSRSAIGDPVACISS
eukprot:7153398-Prymnesium_polylepis.2